MNGRPESRIRGWLQSWREGARRASEPGAETGDASFEETWRGHFKRRVLLVVLGIGVWSVAIEARLVQLQVVQHAEWVERGNRQRQRVVAVPAERGDIVDRNGEMLAYSIDTDTIFGMPLEIKDTAAAIEKLCDALDGCTAADQTWIDRFNKHMSFAVIRREATSAQIARVKKLRLDGISTQTDSRRFYPNVELAAHVLGFVGDEQKGLRGIEGRYDSLIRGKDGQAQIDVDSRNHTVEMRLDQAPTEGATLELTIDESLQHIAERELAAGILANRAQGGSVVVMNPANGEILALANYPTFNPNAFKDFDQESWRNRAVESQYEPGSTFKIVTASAAIEEGVEKIDDMVDCHPGRIVFPGRKPITEAHGADHGLISFEDVIVESSNIGAIRVGLKVGAERIYRYVRRFGFGQALSPDFEGQSGGTVGLPPNDSALASMSMGYQVAVTPMQMATAVSAVANGGTLYEPHILRAIDRGNTRQMIQPKELRRAINPETAATVTGIMESVAVRGTGRKAQLASYQVAGKTGTAAKIVQNRYSVTDYNASFVGFVPSRKPALVIVVVVDTPKAGFTYGGDVAAPIFQHVADAALRRMAVPATINPTSPIIANLVGDVVAQPAGGALVTPVVTLPGGQALVPDVRGLSARDALRVLTTAGLNMRMVGSGVVVEQTPVPGTPLERGAWGLLKFSREAQDPRASGGGGR